ncbi:HesA/MoeB/ThiF family protein [Shewanella goraebulensis]|uniref:HesA/MoeB/ThiF family protein n=1 Tax=Shewanella goraebulensis TaxID=3050637 RepID=UPI00254BC622|nr:HesA/MoeB/ThiF family protein [Shewanella goraebulensis]
MNKLSDVQYMRYSSHVLLPDMGEDGQLKLMNSTVVIIGIGGLGHAVAHQLAAAGVGKIILMDDDIVELSNLPRQLLFQNEDIGFKKVDVAAHKLSLAYADCVITPLCQRFMAQDDAILNDADIVFDCTDNFTSRLLINRIAVRAKKALISGAVSGANGQLFCLDFTQAVSYGDLVATHDKNSSGSDILPSNNTEHKAGCYQCLYPEDSAVNQSCAQAGVLTSALLSVASMQALLGLNWLKSDEIQKRDLKGRLHLFDAKNLQWRHVGMSQDPNCCICALN